MIEYTDEQQAAINMVVGDAPKLCVMTGLPGAGKTVTVRGVIEAAGRAGLRTTCAAPSGKAAQRMEEATGRPASTLHRLMKMMPESDAWSAIETDILIVDESSMVTSQLMACVVNAAEAGRVRTILLVGDSEQLPPVGAGQPFADLLHGEACPTVRLTQIHRQAKESGIVCAAHAIVNGQDPDFNDTDFQMVHCEELEHVPAAVWDVITSNGLDPETSQVLAPQRNTGGGVEAICDFIERSRRPLLEDEPLVRDRFRAGTKVINTRNDYDLKVFNGELGEVVSAELGHDDKGEEKRSKDVLQVEIAGSLKRYAGGGIGALRPAWALTCHKSQGSQWDDVVMVAHPSHAYMLTRRLLYVAVTRAAKRVWLVGMPKAVHKAVRNVRDARRTTWLRKRFERDKARRTA